MEKIEQQPYFPERDLTKQEAAELKDILQNPKLGHVIAPENHHGHLDELLARFSLTADTLPTEAAHTEHMLTQDTLLIPARAVDLASRFGLSHGYTLYEIATSLVSPRTPFAAHAPALIAMRGLDAAVHSQTLPDYLDETKQKLVDEQPNTAELIQQCATWFDVAASEHAILGAAIRRQMELDSREYAQQLVK